VLLPSTLHDFSSPPCSRRVIADMNAQVAVSTRVYGRQRITWPRSLEREVLPALACRDAEQDMNEVCGAVVICTTQAIPKKTQSKV
jgi:hypothetical protein